MKSASDKQLWAVVNCSGQMERAVFPKTVLVVSNDLAGANVCTNHVTFSFAKTWRWPRMKVSCRNGGCVESEEERASNNEEIELVGGGPGNFTLKCKEQEVVLNFSFVWGLPFDEFSFLETLGRGSQAEVKRCVARSTGEAYAAKIFHKHTVLGKGKTIAEALGDAGHLEAEVLQKIRHPNIVSLYRVLETKVHLVLILDLVEGGDLYRLIEARVASRPDGTPPFNNAEARGIFRQMADAVLHLHRAHICHRDLKPSNFLIDHHQSRVKGLPHIKLTDFGTAKIFGHHHVMHRIVWSPLYVAPEMLIHREKGFDSVGYTEKIDVWSLGVCLVNLLTGLMPFISVDEILAGQMDDVIDVSEFTPEAVSLAHQMLCVDPAKRICMDDVVEHPWLLMLDEKRRRTSEERGKPDDAE